MKEKEYSITNLSQSTKAFIEKSKLHLIKSNQIQDETNHKLFEIQQENEFLKDIRIVLNSKVNTLEKAYGKFPITKKLARKNSEKITEKMFFETQMPLMVTRSKIKNIKEKMSENFNFDMIEDFKKLENSVAVAKLQVEEIIDFNEKEKLI